MLFMSLLFANEKEAFALWILDLEQFAKMIYVKSRIDFNISESQEHVARDNGIRIAGRGNDKPRELTG